MGRIEQALKRTGKAVTAPEPAAEAIFASPWSTGLGPEHRPATPADGVVRHALGDECSAAIVGFNTAWKERLAHATEGDPGLVEQFRRLAGILHQAQTANGFRTVMITSGAPSDGKTLVAVNLAVVMSESYQRRVLLIEADLRRPSIGDLVDVSELPGLCDALKARTDQKLAVLKISPTLTLLPAGRPDPDPLGGLTSARMREILDEAVTRFDWVVLDAPPVGPTADAGLLAQMVDGALLVVRAGCTQLPQVRKAVDVVGRERILGVVLNQVNTVPLHYYERYYRPVGDVGSRGNRKR